MKNFDRDVNNEGAEVLFNREDVFVVTPAWVADLKDRALASSRKRARVCLHRTTDHPTQEMVIVFHHESYMPPHRHPQGKSESYHLVEGALRVFIFDDEGRVLRAPTLEAGKSFLYRLSAPFWHMPVPLSEWVVYHEVYTGPFGKTADVEFAPWAPPEIQTAAAAGYVSRLLADSAAVS
ncbi:MAG: WbuC family cupin fold metalloprotein [Desulfobulbaceae bacterium]|nr:WbuC family cupin fold metalloprotein [Desulfobulbaceae bacterium]